VGRTHPVGKTVLELQNMSDGHLLVIGLQCAGGHVLHSGFIDEKLRPGDALVIIGRVHSFPPARRPSRERWSGSG
jgi:hypothetical protein